jgi:hypothetical protein
MAEVYFFSDVKREVELRDDTVAWELEQGTIALTSYLRKITELLKRQKYCPEEQEQIRAFLNDRLQKAQDVKIALEASHNWFYHLREEERFVTLSYLDELAGKVVLDNDPLAAKPTVEEWATVNAVLRALEEKDKKVAISELIRDCELKGVDQSSVQGVIKRLKKNCRAST